MEGRIDSAGGESSGRSTDREIMTLLELAAFFVRNAKVILAFPAAVAVVTGVVVLLQPREYTASATFISEVDAPSTTALSGLAAQLGVVGSFGGTGESPAFYADLVRSREVLIAVASKSYSFTADGERYEGDLPTLLEIESDDPEARIRAAAGIIGDELDLRVRGNGIVALSVKAPHAALAQQVTAAILDEINRFNVERRQSRAGAERRFVEGRLEAVRAEYREAEDTLRAFLDRNRQFQNSLPLVFENERLERELRLRQQLLISLNQGYEQARIEEVKNTPVITVIESPRLPLQPNGRWLLLKALMAAFLAGLLAMGYAAIRESVVRSRQDARPDYREFREAVSQVRTPRATGVST